MSETAAPDDGLYVPGSEVDKISKLSAKYFEFPEFAHADLKKGYFCANCVYFWEGHDDCAIVYSKGESSEGKTSDRIAPYGMCALWKPNMDIILGKPNGSESVVA